MVPSGYLVLVQNPMQVNDWSFHRLFATTVALTASLWGLVGLAALGIRTDLERAIVTLAYVGYLPGILTLRALRMHKLGSAKTLLYGAGVSLTMLMFIVVALNSLFGILRLQSPISLWPLLVAVTLLVLGLCALDYFVDRGYDNPEYVSIGGLVSPQA